MRYLSLPLLLDFAGAMGNISVSSDDSEAESVWTVVDAGGFFTLDHNDTELQIVKKLQLLREETYQTEIDFNVGGIEWTERIAAEAIETFQQYARTNLRWNKAAFEDSNPSEPFFRVVETAAKLKLFRQLTFENAQTMERPLDLRFAAAIASVIREGRHLELVTVGNFEISANAMAVLATGLATAGQTDGLVELCFSYNRFIGRAESGGLMGASEYLAAGLASNTTLKKLCLFNAHLNDTSLAGIVEALSSHPSLEVLQLDSCDYGTRTIHNIHQWLRSDGCRLRKLEMDDAYESADQPEGNLNIVQLFVENLPQNTSLESLSISSHPNIDENDINLLLGSLWKLPNLKSLDVSGNGIADFVSLAANLAGTMPTHRLRSLDLGDNDWLQELFVSTDDDRRDSIEKSILQLLEDVFPELGDLGEDFEGAFQLKCLPSSVGRKLDRNRCFGLLLRGASIPLAVWPLVMAKTNKDRLLAFTAVIEPSRTASLLYEMLQGPAFVGRESL